MYRNNCPCWAALISGIHRMLIPTKTITKILKKNYYSESDGVQTLAINFYERNSYFPTTSCSRSLACVRTRLQMSMVNTVAALLNTDVKELIKAASITAIIKPRMPKNKNIALIIQLKTLEIKSTNIKCKSRKNLLELILK